MSVYELTVFAGTTLANGNRCMVSMQETRPVVTRMGYLENGAKFDADGTASGDRMLGQVKGRFLMLPDSAGAYALATQIAVLEGVRGLVGTLSGYRAGASAQTMQCVARCVDVTTEEYVIGNQPGLAANNKLYAYVNVTWEKKSEWATTSGSAITGEG